MKTKLLMFSCLLTAGTLSAATLEFSTFLGGSSDDLGNSLSVDGSGNCFVTGNTFSTDFPTTSGAYDTSFNGGDKDTFVTKLNSSGSSLVFSTFLGGSSNDSGNSLSVDGSGNCFVTGNTWSTDFPTTSGAYDTSFGGYSDAFVTKLNSSGSSLVFSTFLGGSSDDYGYSLSVDGSGNCFVTGKTLSTDFPTTSGAYDTSLGGYRDAFVTKLNSSGSSLVFSTFLGGSGNDYGNSLSVDGSGNCFVTGDTFSTDFPTTSGAYDTSFNGPLDAFVTKLNSSGSSLVFSTFLGGSDIDYGNSLSVDGSGNCFVTGYTWSTDFPTTSGAYDTSLGGSFSYVDAFVTKLNSSGSSLVFSTFLGGSSNDSGNSLSVDGSGNCFVTGYTESTDFPTTSGAYDTSLGGPLDAFVTKLNSSGSSLVFSTFLGGSSYDYGSSLSVDGSGNCFVTGNTSSTDFPTTSGAYDTSLGGYYDAFVTKFSFVSGDLVPVSLVSASSTNATQSYTPQVQISNLETSLTSTPATATMEISFGGNLIYTNTQNVPAILPASSQNFSFAPLTPYRSGTYEVLVYTELVGDANPQNDTLTTSFEVLGDVALNEFLPFGNSQFDPTFTEFFEIANATNNALNISGWQIRNSANQTITVANGTTIPANDFFVFTKYSNVLLNGGLAFDYTFSPTSFTLGDATDFLVVKDAGGTLVDSVFYNGSWNTVQGEAFERKNVKLDPLNALSWCKGTTVFGTESNKGTPGSASSCLSQLADGSLSVATLNFGNVALLDSSEISVILYSSGSATLTVSSLTISGTGFSTDLTGISVVLGDSASFSVKFKPSAQGLVLGSLEVFTNDWNTPVYTILLNGTGVDGISPAKIKNFRTSENNGTSLKLKWTATGDDTTSGTVAGYELRRSTSEITEANFSSATLVSNLPTPSASGVTDSVTVSGLTSGTQYYFGLKATDNAGNTSELVTVTNFDRTEITSITDVNNDNGKQVRIVFNGNFNDYTIGTGLNTNQYAVYRKVNPLYAPSGKVYTNQTLENLPVGNWEVVGTVPAFGETSYTTVVPTLADSNALGTHEFEFLVRAVSIVSPTINSVSEVVTGFSIDNLAPPAPSNPSFTNNGNGTLTASWNAVYAPDVAFYSIYSLFQNDTYTLLAQVPSTGSATQNYTFNAAQGSVGYFIGSKDINGNEGLPPFDRITSLEVEVVGSDVVLSWLGKLNAVNYKIYRSVKPDLSGSVQIGTTQNPTTVFTDSGAAGGTKYFYFVTWEN